VALRLRGGSNLTDTPDHRTRLWINNDTADAADFTWDGRRSRTAVRRHAKSRSPSRI